MARYSILKMVSEADMPAVYHCSHCRRLLVEGVPLAVAAFFCLQSSMSQSLLIKFIKG